STHVRQRRVSALLHHVTELTGELHLSRAEHLGDLDEEDFTTDTHPSEAGSHAALLGTLRNFAGEFHRAKVLPQIVLCLDDKVRCVALGYLHRHTADNACDSTLQ